MIPITINPYRTYNNFETSFLDNTLVYVYVYMFMYNYPVKT